MEIYNIHYSDLLKEKEKIMNSTGEKQLITYRGVPTWLTTDFSSETVESRRQWNNRFKVLKEKAVNQK